MRTDEKKEALINYTKLDHQFRLIFTVWEAMKAEVAGRIRAKFELVVNAESRCHIGSSNNKPDFQILRIPSDPKVEIHISHDNHSRPAPLTSFPGSGRPPRGDAPCLAG